MSRCEEVAVMTILFSSLNSLGCELVISGIYELGEFEIGSRASCHSVMKLGVYQSKVY